MRCCWSVAESRGALGVRDVSNCDLDKLRWIPSGAPSICNVDRNHVMSR